MARDLVAANITVCTANANDWRPMANAVGIERAKQIVGRVRWLAEHGVRLVTGTDAGMGPFDNFPTALRGFVQWGFSPAEIIAMTTVQTADAIGLSGRTGQLAAGLDADLIVLRGDPLSDLAALDHAELVIARGRLHRPSPSIRVLLNRDDNDHKQRGDRVADLVNDTVVSGSERRSRSS